MGAGNDGEILVTKCSSFLGPPVDTPIKTTSKGAVLLFRTTFCFTTGGSFIIGRCALPVFANAFILLINGVSISEISLVTVPPVFRTKSLAPSASASKVIAAPFCVSDDTIMVGHGYSFLSKAKHVIPSITGILISSVIQSGLNSTALDNASSPLRAT